MTPYRSEPAGRWLGFEHRPGDVVVSTRSKCGTTWMQTICCLLIHQQSELHAPLGELSPWLDWEVEPFDVVRARLDAQVHRRVIKTHVPLAGLPLDPRVTYIVVVRDPLDVGVSFFHHLRNIDQARMAELRGDVARRPSAAVMTMEAWLDAWIDDQTDPAAELDTLPGNLHHLDDAWGRRHQPNVVLARYEDLQHDLDGEMRRIAARLGLDVPADLWPDLVAATRFDSMRQRSSTSTPDHLGVLRDRSAFFRSGVSGEGRAACSGAQLERYHRRVIELAEPGATAWLRAEPGRAAPHEA